MICKVCGEPISKGAKKGLCRSCAGRIRVINSGRKCKKCGKPITKNNSTDECYRCKLYNRTPEKHSKTNTWYKDKRIICYRCKRRFRARKDQHPKYSFCPVCKTEVKYISDSSHWIDKGGFVR